MASTTCSASAFELVVYLTVRADAFYRKSFFACLSVVTVGIVLLPLFMTNTASYGAARKVCHDYTYMRINVTRWDIDSQVYDPEWDVEDNAVWHLFPQHLFNSISTVASLFGFWVWLFFSPHMSDVVRDLDRTCTNPIVFLKVLKCVTMCCSPHVSSCSSFSFAVGSYFALQWLANLLVTAASLGTTCVQSATAQTVLSTINLLAMFGLSVIATNLLCHRYLVEKARVMIKMYGTHGI